jgi:hypothetical protein
MQSIAKHSRVAGRETNLSKSSEKSKRRGADGRRLVEFGERARHVRGG